MPKFLVDSAVFVVISTALLYFAGYVHTDSYYASLGLHMSLVSMSPDEAMMMGSLPMLAAVSVVWLVLAFIFNFGGYLFNRFYLSDKKSAADMAADKWLIHTISCVIFAAVFVYFVKYCAESGRSSAERYAEKCWSSTYEFTISDGKDSVISGCLIRYSMDTYWVLSKDNRKHLLGLKKDLVKLVTVVNTDGQSN